MRAAKISTSLKGTINIMFQSVSAQYGVSSEKLKIEFFKKVSSVTHSPSHYIFNNWQLLHKYLHQNLMKPLI